MDPWVCYLLKSLTSNKTYIGATNNMEKRLQKHNTGKGAKYTRGQKWIPIIVISGFNCKRSTLSFESGWKKMHRNRKKNISVHENITYSTNTIWNRIIDLYHFMNNITCIETKFKLNRNNVYPVILPVKLIIWTFYDDIMVKLGFPDYVIIWSINEYIENTIFC